MAFGMTPQELRGLDSGRALEVRSNMLAAVASAGRVRLCALRHIVSKSHQ